MATIDTDQFIDETRARIRGILPDPSKLTDELAGAVLTKYEAMFAPNFTDLLDAVQRCAVAIKAARALSEHLRTERLEAHAELLRDFVASSRARPGMDWRPVAHTHLCNHVFTRVTGERGMENSVFGVAVIALLENTSLDFIPVLRQAGEVVGATNVEYLDLHGEADIEHAEGLRRALFKEVRMYELEDAMSQLRDAAEATTHILRFCFVDW